MYDEIIKLVRQEDVVLFLGAGCSLDSGAPSASEVARRLKGLLTDTFIPTNESLREISEALVLQDGSRDRLNCVLKESFSSLRPTDSHKQLSTIPYIKDIVTTNYDSLIESSYRQDIVQTFTEDQDCSSYSVDRYHIFKIHGDLEHPNSIVITDTDYNHTIRSHKDSLLWSMVKSLFATKHIVFIGYSISDGNFLNLIEEVIHCEREKNKQMFLISPELNDIAQAKLHKLNITSIKGSFNSFIEACILSLKESFGEDFSSYRRNEAAAQFGRNNGVQIESRDNGEKIYIESIRCSGSQNISFELSDNRKDSILNPSQYSEAVRFGEVTIPAISLKSDEIQTFKLTSNGLNVTKGLNLRQIYIAPIAKKIRLRIRAKKENVTKSSDAYLFCLPEHELHLKMNVVFGEADVHIQMPASSNDTMKFTLTTKYFETFEDLPNAIDWLKIICGFRTGNIVITAKNTRLADFGNIQTDQLSYYGRYLEYCTNIQDIEDKGGIVFYSYERISDERLYASQVIKSYIENKPLYVRANLQTKRFSVRLSEKIDTLEKDNYFAMTYTKLIDKPFFLCGKKFDIPQETIFRSKAHLIDILQCDDNSINYIFDDESDSIQLMFPKINS